MDFCIPRFIDQKDLVEGLCIQVDKQLLTFLHVGQHLVNNNRAYRWITNKQ